MKQILLFSIILQLAFTVSLHATHIVGGEFELIYINDFNYQLNLIQYFDDVNGALGAEEQFTDVSIFRKSDNAFVSSVRLFNVGSTFVPYTNPECADARLVTRRIVYTAEIQLPPSTYNDAEGYYMVYERCCRNGTISNLTNPLETGQTFYLEFPAVTQNEEPFINSSPILFPPLSDYACINNDFYFDFRGTDSDGDSLSYSLSAPINSSYVAPVPQPTPAPHDVVEFTPGIGVENMIPGTPALQIDQQGFLRVRPNRLGLFVFSITVDEFREGKKIGSVKRDFQMLVIDCQTGTPPEVSATVPGRPEVYKDSTTVIKFAAEEEKCFQLQVTDADAPEKISVRAKAVNFNADLSEIFPELTQFTTGSNDTLKFDICLPDCPLANGKPAIIDFLVMDDACSLPLMDTMRLIFEVEDAGNEVPYIVDNKGIIPITLNAGETFELVIQGKDNDGDLLSLEAVPEGFSLQDLGMNFPTLQAGPGEITKIFRWTADCEKYNLEDNNSLSLTFLLEDDNACTSAPGDSLRLDIQINLPENHPPAVTTTGLNDTDVNVLLGETLTFTVVGDDPDNNFITLEALGNGFDLAEVNVNFQNTSGVGRVGSVFSWKVDCEYVDLSTRQNFEFLFVATDQGACNTSQADTLRVNVHIVPNVNTVPEMAANGPVEQVDENEYTAQAVVGNRIFFRVEATDEDNDVLLLTLDKVFFGEQEIDRNLVSFNFFAAQGIGRVSSQFFWVPDCIFLEKEYQDSKFKLLFTAMDDNCIEAKSDTITVTLQLTDRPIGFEEYIPPNVFTPNSDEWNPYFELPNLPEGNCANQFEYIEIFNRWGKSVFTSQQKDFRWYGQDAPPGVYFYQVKYTDYVYKGTVSLLH